MHTRWTRRHADASWAGDPARFESIGHTLRQFDQYMCCADFDSYYEAQRGIDARWQVMPAWTRSRSIS